MIMGILYDNTDMKEQVAYKTTAPATMADMTGSERYTVDASIDTSPVDQYLSILQDHIYSLRATVIDLVHRLEPVLSPVVEEPVPNVVLPTTTCRMSVVLNKFVFELHEIEQLVQTTRSHLQL